jgi:hypothetical protein
MRILLANQPWDAFGGSETYLLTIAPHLQRLGHEVELYAPAEGRQADAARERGLAVVTAASELPQARDVVVTQHAESAYAMAERYPEAARVYVAHSLLFAPQRPPEAGVCHAVVAMNNGVKRFCEALAHGPEVVRMTQPIDISRFNGRGGPGQRPRRVLLLGNHWLGPENRNHRIVAEACESLGLELDHVGVGGRVSSAPELDIARADVVVGIGRCVLEGMAAARPAYVFGDRGGDGWITPENYEALEAKAFAGTSTPRVTDARGLREDLAGYDAEMGAVNRDLVIAHHDAVRHATDLVHLFKRLAPTPASDHDQLAVLAGMVRRQQETESRVWVAEADAVALRRELATARDHVDAVTSTRSYRLARLLGAPVRRLRRRA